MVGAILEGALHMAENSEFPVGMYLGILTAVGLLVSLIISKVFPTFLLSHRVLPATFARSIFLQVSCSFPRKWVSCRGKKCVQ